MESTENALPQREVWDTRQVAAYLGMSGRTLERLAEVGEGPPRVRLSARRVAYLRADVLEWLHARRAPVKAA